MRPKVAGLGVDVVRPKAAGFGVEGVADAAAGDNPWFWVLGFGVWSVVWWGVRVMREGL